jgi:transcriptional regulator with GAF, ATPase, and Fis domain
MSGTTRKAAPRKIGALSAKAGPALCIAYSGGRPLHVMLPLLDGKLALGRDELIAVGVHDELVSRRHLLARWDGGRFLVSDQGSTNGSFVGGAPLRGEVAATGPVRIGHTIVLCESDGGGEVTSVGGVIAGPKTRALLDRVAMLARAGEGVLLGGETGSGKEVLARHFHESGPCPRGPFVAVNCATVPRELAERLFFGARRGAYSGAVADADGYIQAAAGGTLFLDEVGELEPGVQAKLLRVLETREVQALGANRPQKIDVRVCAATLRDLRDDVAAGRFREDLYFRLGRPELRVPPLRDRPLEIVWLVHQVVQTLARARSLVLTASAELVEACLLRPWPGNVRELQTSVRIAVLNAVERSDHTVEPDDLDDHAGRPLVAQPGAARLSPEVEDALRVENGNVNRAATRLGMSRARLRRLIERNGIDVAALRHPRR